MTKTANHYDATGNRDELITGWRRRDCSGARFGARGFKADNEIIELPEAGGMARTTTEGLSLRRDNEGWGGFVYPGRDTLA